MKICKGCKLPKNNFYKTTIKRASGKIYKIDRAFCKDCYKTQPKLVLRSKIHQYLKRCKKRASDKNLGFDLTFNFIKHLLSQACCYCDSETFITIDRYDNALGYIQSNCVPVVRDVTALNMICQSAFG